MLKQLKKRELLIALLFSLPAAFFQAYGKAIKDIGELEYADKVIVSVNTVVFTLVIMGLYLFLRKKLMRGRSRERAVHEDRKYYRRCVMVLFLAWLPVFLAYYPGLFAYDVTNQIPQKPGTYSTHHPLLHTLYLQVFFYAGKLLLHDSSLGIACASLVQMLLLAMMIAWTHLFFYRMGVCKRVRYVLIGLSAVLPFFSVLSVSMTKDVLFSGLAALFVTNLCYWEKMPEYYDRKPAAALYVFSAAGVILMRNNGIYGILAVTAVNGICAFFDRKRSRQLVFTAAGLLMGILLSFGLKTVLQAKEGSPNEALSLPYQQTAYVYCQYQDELSEEDCRMILELIPDAEEYDPYLADRVKGDAHGAERPEDFLRLYIKLGIRYPASCLRAFTTNNLGYLYLQDVSNAEIYGNELEERQGYLLTDTKQGYGVEHRSFFPALEQVYEILFSANRYQDLVFLKLLCAPALYFWGVLLLIFLAFDLHRKELLFPALFTGTYMLTLLAGPCALIRYIFPCIICLPLMAVCAFGPEPVTKEGDAV